jgi:hypothetical protein
VTLGAITQVRVLGGIVGTAICQAALNRLVRFEFGDILSAEQMTKLLQSAAAIRDLNVDQISAVQHTYGKGFNSQSRMLMYFVAGAVIVSLLCFTWPRKPGNADEEATRLRTDEVEKPLPEYVSVTTRYGESEVVVQTTLHIPR